MNKYMVETEKKKGDEDRIWSLTTFLSCPLGQIAFRINTKMSYLLLHNDILSFQTYWFSSDPQFLLLYHAICQLTRAKLPFAGCVTSLSRYFIIPRDRDLSLEAHWCPGRPFCTDLLFSVFCSHKQV